MNPLVQDNVEAIIDLCREYGVVRLEVFGSVCTGEFDPARSDVDFIVEYPPNDDLGPWGARQFELQECLGSLLGREVELFGVSMLSNKWVRAEAAKTRHLLYQSPDHISVLAGDSDEPVLLVPTASLHPKAPKWLDDVSGASAFIHEVLDGKTLADYAADPGLRAVVERNLVVIGGALGGINRVDPTTAAGLPDIQEYIDVGEHVIRDYHAVDTPRVWRLVHGSISKLRRASEVLLKRASEAA